MHQFIYYVCLTVYNIRQLILTFFIRININFNKRTTHANIKLYPVFRFSCQRKMMPFQQSNTLWVCSPLNI